MVMAAPLDRTAVMTTTIHRCAECNHKSDDHGHMGQRDRVGPCCYGGCACRLTPAQVAELNPEVEIPTFPASDTGSGVWLKRAGS